MMSSTVIEFISEDTETVDDILKALLSYEEVLGVVAVTVEGLVMGSVGIVEDDIDVVSLLGASLVGVAERSTRRLGTGAAVGLTLLTNDGMITIRNGGDFALMIFSAMCDQRVLHNALIEPMAQIAQILNPM
jgi:predicted regulator of Ras-like GTPase activity (Roadblock/LC7/MglB family)